MKTLHIHQLVKSRSTFIDFALETYKTELELLEGIHKLATDMIKEIEFSVPEPDSFKVVLYIACIRTVCAVESVIALSLLGNSADSVLVLRSIFELAINILYIEKEPKTRSLLYSRHEIVPVMKFLKRELENSSMVRKELEAKLQYCAEQLSRFDKEIHALEPKFDIPDGINWSGKQIKEMAEEVGLKDAYSVLYWILSAVSHSGGYSSHLYMSVNMSEVTPKYYPNDEYAGRVTITTALYSLKILSVANEYLKMGKTTDIDKLSEEFKKTKPLKS